jgi:RND superfamily putative drug exporter
VWAALSFAMPAVVPLRSFREFALTMCVGVPLETFLVRPALVPALARTRAPGAEAPSRTQSGLVAIAQIVTA